MKSRCARVRRRSERREEGILKVLNDNSSLSRRGRRVVLNIL
jgi:hypothetical protein